MAKDVMNLHEANFERDSKICNFHDVELRLPFAAYDIVRFAVGLQLELKMERSKETLRKLVLRRVARNLELSQSVVNKPKKAVQYTTGVSQVLNRIAKQKELSTEAYLQEVYETVFKEIFCE